MTVPRPGIRERAGTDIQPLCLGRQRDQVLDLVPLMGSLAGIRNVSKYFNNII